MLIEDPEGFKTWLTAKLEPLCEADPAALAKYVYALVKKDKPIEELKSSMIDQLEVFLQKETKGFVELLFKTLQTKDFEVKASELVKGPSPPHDIDLRKTLSSHNHSVNPVSTLVVNQSAAIAAPESRTVTIVSAANDDQPPGTTVTTLPTKQNNEPSVAATPVEPMEERRSPVPLLASSAPRKPALPDKHSKKNELGDDLEELPPSSQRVRSGGGGGPRGRGLRRGMSMSPPPGDRGRRSRSYDRGRRSRSRDRDRSRAWRNKSPPLRNRYMPDRRRSYSKSPIRRHSRSRSPPVKRGRYRNRSPPRSRTRSLTPSRNSLERDRGMGGSPGRRDTDLRLGSSISSALRDRGMFFDIDNDKKFGTKRCRDFDEKGFCMSGDLCPFDHGSDPVVLEDLPGSVYNGANQVGPRSGTAPAHMQLHHPHDSPNNILEYNPAATIPEPRGWRRFYRPGAIRGRGGGMMGGGVGGGGSLPVPGAMEGAPFPKRELISVITGGSPLPPRDSSTPPYRATLPHSHEGGMGKRYEPYPRLGGASRRNMILGGMKAPMPPATPTNFTLQLKKVPTHLNNISHLNDHFSKFGKIVNILVGFEGDPESALITFSSYMEANSAYKSTEPILNNRFVKVFWYTPSANANNAEGKDDKSRASVLERLGSANSLDNKTKVLNSLQPANVTQQQEARANSKVVMSNNNISKTIYVASALKKENNINRVVNKEDLVKKKVDEEALKEVKKKLEAKKEKIKMNAELRKRKQVLLEKQLNQQKLLIEKMEAGNIKAEQKTTIMATIKSLQESIEKLKKDLAQDVEASMSTIQSNKKPTTPPPNPAQLLKKTKEETQRELLDAELDLLKQEQQGKDIVELKKKISDLKVKAFKQKQAPFKAVVVGIRGRGGLFRTRRGVGGISRGRGSSRFIYNSLDYNVIDHRPTKLLVSGYEQDDKAQVITHFGQYGEILNYTSDDATPSLVFNYKSRKEAEAALAKGKNFQDRLLSVTWATPNHNIRPGVTTSNTPTPSGTDEELPEDVLTSGAEDDELVGLMSPSESLILQDDEEEDEEDRTWRR